MKSYLIGIATLLCSSIAIALPLNDFACSASGGATVTPDVAEACIVWDIKQVGNDRVSYNFDGEAASTGDIVPTFAAFGATGPTIIQRILIQIDPLLTASDIFNASSGYLGVGIIDTLYGVIFENLAEEFSVTFETRTLPTLGRFLGFGETGDGTLFILGADNVPIPGLERAGQDVPEPATFPLCVLGIVFLMYRKVSLRRRVLWA